jgi:hypothetical protein
MYLTKEIKEEIFLNTEKKKNTLENPKLKLLCSLAEGHLTEHLKKIVMIINTERH